MAKVLLCGYATIDIIGGKKYLGGGAGTLSISASKKGNHSFLCTALSQDKDGKWYTGKLKTAKVNLSLSTFKATSLSTCIIKNPHGKGSQRIWQSGNIDKYFKEIHIKKNQLRSFDWVIVVNANPTLVKTVAGASSKRNIFYIPGPQAVLQKNFVVKEIFKQTHTVFANEEEAKYVFARKPFTFGVRYVVVTRGPKNGTVYLNNGQEHYFKAAEKSRVVDPTGAGDNFALGFALETLKKNSLEKAIETGKKYAKKVVQKTGGLL